VYFAVAGRYSQRIKLLMNAIALTGAVLFAGTACGTDEIRLEGVITKDPEFEGGNCAILTTEQGDLYELSGGDRKALVDGRHVVVRGVVPETWCLFASSVRSSWCTKWNAAHHFLGTRPVR
jgi:hypothetical protein